jgi:transcriptional regulator with XRE-family HTH domain
MSYTISYRIKELREARGWSQADLAERCGTTQQAIQRYESGAREPKTSAIAAMSRAFNVTVSYVLGLDDDPEPHGVELTADERELLGLFRSTDERGRAAIMAVARSQRGAGAVPERSAVAG